MSTNIVATFEEPSLSSATFIVTSFFVVVLSSFFDNETVNKESSSHWFRSRRFFSLISFSISDEACFLRFGRRVRRCLAFLAPWYRFIALMGDTPSQLHLQRLRCYRISDRRRLYSCSHRLILFLSKQAKYLVQWRRSYHHLSIENWMIFSRFSSLISLHESLCNILLQVF